jgi:hypothetical protein
MIKETIAPVMVRDIRPKNRMIPEINVINLKRESRFSSFCNCPVFSLKFSILFVYWSFGVIWYLKRV